MLFVSNGHAENVFMTTGQFLQRIHHEFERKIHYRILEMMYFIIILLQLEM